MIKLGIVRMQYCQRVQRLTMKLVKSYIVRGDCIHVKSIQLLI